jgi:hypothetical protein
MGVPEVEGPYNPSSSENLRGNAFHNKVIITSSQWCIGMRDYCSSFGSTLIVYARNVKTAVQGRVIVDGRYREAQRGLREHHIWRANCTVMVDLRSLLDSIGRGLISVSTLRWAGRLVEVPPAMKTDGCAQPYGRCGCQLPSNNDSHLAVSSQKTSNSFHPNGTRNSRITSTYSGAANRSTVFMQTSERHLFCYHLLFSSAIDGRRPW